MCLDFQLHTIRIKIHIFIVLFLKFEHRPSQHQWKSPERSKLHSSCNTSSSLQLHQNRTKNKPFQLPPNFGFEPRISENQQKYSSQGRNWYFSRNSSPSIESFQNRMKFFFLVFVYSWVLTWTLWTLMKRIFGGESAILAVRSFSFQFHQDQIGNKVFSFYQFFG